MKSGERNIYIGIAVLVVVMMVYRGYQEVTDPDPGIPFYTTASTELQQAADKIYKENKCSNCHTLWMTRNMMANVPAPPLDGIGAIRSEEWFFEYLSAENPQDILPTRLSNTYKMPSYAHLPESDRRTLAAYLASLQVEDWFLEETRKMEYEKLTGKKYQAAE